MDTGGRTTQLSANRKPKTWLRGVYIALHIPLNHIETNWFIAYKTTLPLWMGKLSDNTPKSVKEQLKKGFFYSRPPFFWESNSTQGIEVHE